LLFRHREPAGEILSLAYDTRGRLLVDARVDHVEARRCSGLSVAATIVKYELRDQDDPQNFHALITRADLDEVSLTASPCNPACVVTSRISVSPALETYDLAAKGITRLMEVVEQLRNKLNAEPPPAKTPKHPHAVAPPRRSPAAPAPPPSCRTTPFSQLVAAMAANHQEQHQ
jgi:hypothetical protein